MLLYRTKKRIRRGLVIGLAALCLFFYLVIGANTEGRFGSALPILLERSLGSWIRTWSAPVYARVFSEQAITASSELKNSPAMYPVLEYLTFDERISARSSLKKAFFKTIDESIAFKTRRMAEIAGLLEVQALLGDKEALSLETKAASRFHLDTVLADIRFLEGLVLFSNDGKVDKPVYSFGHPARIGASLKRKIILNDGRYTISEGKSSPRVYVGVPVQGVIGNKPVGMLIARYRHAGFIDLQAFFDPRHDISYGLFYRSTDWMQLHYQGGAFSDKPMVGNGVFQSTGKSVISHAFAHPAGFVLNTYAPVRTVGFFVFRIFQFILLAGLVYLSVAVVRHVIKVTENFPVRPVKKKDIYHNIYLSLENTGQSIDATRQVLDELKKAPAGSAHFDAGNLSLEQIRHLKELQGQLALAPASGTEPAAVHQIKATLDHQGRLLEQLAGRFGEAAAVDAADPEVPVEAVEHEEAAPLPDEEGVEITDEVVEIAEEDVSDGERSLSENEKEPAEEDTQWPSEPAVDHINAAEEDDMIEMVDDQELDPLIEGFDETDHSDDEAILLAADRADGQSEAALPRDSGTEEPAEGNTELFFEEDSDIELDSLIDDQVSELAVELDEDVSEVEKKSAATGPQTVHDSSSDGDDQVAVMGRHMTDIEQIIESMPLVIPEEEDQIWSGDVTAAARPGRLYDSLLYPEANQRRMEGVAEAGAAADQPDDGGFFYFEEDIHTGRVEYKGRFDSQFTVPEYAR